MTRLWALGPLLALGLGASPEVYSDNAVCRQNSCVNPLFPGVNDLPNLEKLVWQVSTESVVKPYLEFCKGVVQYDPALPSPNATSQSIDKIVKAQDAAAAKMYFFHLNGIGYEAWDYTDPGQGSDPCVKSVWRLSCFTYFPKSQAGGNVGETTPYYRPCKNSCQSYLQACRVECCDESPQCVFEIPVKSATNSSLVLIESGYSDADGPSALCTGSSSGARSLASPLPLLLLLFGLQLSLGTPAVPRKEKNAAGWGQLPLVLALAVCALCLQGCSLDVDSVHHSVGNWRAKPNYLVNFEYVPSPNASGVLNSCSLPEALKCSGRGKCMQWSKTSRGHAVGTDAATLLYFCKCDQDWADPECRTPRKSQIRTFVLSLFGGFLGADYFYLGFPVWGLAKASTLGGVGVWWLIDVVRSGSGPVYASDFRCAQDLPHFVFVLVTVVLFLIIGFFVSIESFLSQRRKKREELMKLQHAEECRRMRPLDEMDGPRYKLPYQQSGFDTSRSYSGYGSTLPMPMQNAGAPYATSSPHRF